MKKCPHVVFFLLMIALLGLLNLFNFNKPTVSALEHRALMKKPDLNMQDLLVVITFAIWRITIAIPLFFGIYWFKQAGR